MATKLGLQAICRWRKTTIDGPHDSFYRARTRLTPEISVEFYAALCWNLGISATITENWPEAHKSWRQLGYVICRDRRVAPSVASLPGLLYLLAGAPARLSMLDPVRGRDHSTGRVHVRDAQRVSSFGAEAVYPILHSWELVRIETRGPDGAELEPAWQYSYDALGRRTEVRRGGYRRQFYWDGDRLAAEVMPNGALRVYEYAGHGALVPLAFTDYASADASPESGKHYTVFTDPVGQPLQIEDQNPIPDTSVDIENPE